jgi:hypothetical protein
VLGADLHVGDTIEVWWRPGHDTIIELRPYTGSLLSFFPRGVRRAIFIGNPIGTIIGNDDFRTRVSKGANENLQVPAPARRPADH